MITCPGPLILTRYREHITYPITQQFWFKTLTSKTSIQSCYRDVFFLVRYDVSVASSASFNQRTTNNKFM